MRLFECVTLMEGVEVITLLEQSEVDRQVVKKAAELKENDYVTFQKMQSLRPRQACRRPASPSK